MLEPREADIPVLFLVLVVLPLVTYILLGKWNEVAKKKDRVSLLAQVAAEETLLAEAVPTASVIPVVVCTKSGFHECARCFGPAKTRCSRCKSVRYCSGKCQIIHWRMGHKEACQQLESTCLNISPKPFSDEESVHERALPNEYQDGLFQGYEIGHSIPDSDTVDKPNHPSSNTSAASTNTTTVDTCEVLMAEKKHVDKRVSRKLNRETLRRGDAALLGSRGGACGSWDGSSNLSNVIPSKKASMRHKLGNDDPIASSEQISKKHTINIHDDHNLRGQNECISKSGSDPCTTSSLHSEKTRTGLLEVEMDFTSDRNNFLRERLASNSETVDLISPPEIISAKGSTKSKSTLHPSEPKISGSPGSTLKASRESSCSGMLSKGRVANESKVLQASAFTAVPGKDKNVLSDTIMRKMGIKKLPKVPRQDARGVNGDGRKRNKVLFPYEEFVRLFQYEGWDLSPRGLLNCGNSCYANAVLQCLTCTKPLIIYLLQRSHSRICCMKDWCLMCELEEHVMMLREAGGPLSPDKILLHMRRIGCRMGSGSQEDAHEFLRLLVTSMQLICLEGSGGEKQVNSSLQETTFIQHTFGGHLRSKVKCLRCHHESERYENIMDLTLEIHGWVESLEDALTQFTAPEDLDGENMYRCGRCATYVKARKQLSIHEAPNILTIVLKRFQTGKYGKINKCITFPDMLDMIPFMTGTGDSPPLYMLYAVVVHLDTLNASFSGHYVSYVKDVQGMWFRIDDTEVQTVPTSQVMSEGAYILFYSRSCPRLPRVSPLQHPTTEMHCLSKQNLSRSGQTRHNDNFFVEAFASDPRQDLWLGSGNQTSNDILRCANGNTATMRETYPESMSMEFSDATSSDWSIFTSSDDASFTTESTRDSFSTSDYADTVNLDPISSIFNSFYPPEYSSHRTVSCRRFSVIKPQTRFLSEDKGFVWDSSLSNEPLDSVQNGKNPKQVRVFST
ncbi:ubiquitin carboxyl-terminal hydrolase 15-like [Macadamia integrifolia]|uniref:ubiquitin carboxyl-terminal hydrolase 15-like n=1 Tax=Macadamia integrifolia TaxID=60698 RepID=UPI001C530472|nr:ubiquitin carboxyl-terminal hydrolase 15-like [Macadamia integrifolia]XP_042478578.1 ubiquitin carboxyl-terminal hydrolase 15-like [Macadamia integrifolia]